MKATTRLIAESEGLAPTARHSSMQINTARKRTQLPRALHSGKPMASQRQRPVRDSGFFLL